MQSLTQLQQPDLSISYRKYLQNSSENLVNSRNLDLRNWEFESLLDLNSDLKMLCELDLSERKISTPLDSMWSVTQLQRLDLS